MRFVLRAGSILYLYWACFLPMAMACGGFFCQLAQPVLQSGEAIIFGVKGNNVTMHVQILYEGPADAFSWVLPVPFQPQVDVGSDRIFTALFQSTLPTFQLDIQEVATDTCSENAYQPKSECPPAMVFAETVDAGGAVTAGADNAVVLDEGSVGPFDFVILEAADNDPSSVFRWLEENGYDQPDESAALLTHYAENNHKFVALRLQKEAETGEIQPLILKYEMPTTTSPSPIACVPIQLTRIAATQNMPIQVYILGDVRASPLNFIEMELDDTQVPWLACLNNPRCYDDDYRQRFSQAADELVNHTFITEYAGPASIAQGLIVIPVSAEDIASVETEQQFFERYYFALPNNVPLINTIVAEHTSTFFLNNSEPKDEQWVFNATLLAKELDEKVLQPAIEDQAYVDSFPYLTRLYARLSPEAMTKDPFFAFKEELPDVDQVHRADAQPICVDNVPTALEVTVERGGETVTVAAAFDPCGGFLRWTAAPDSVIVNKKSPAQQLASWGFSTDPGIVVLRSDNGTFDMQAVQAAIAFGDSLVMSQVIPATPTQAGTTPAPSIPTPMPSNVTSESPSVLNVTNPPAQAIPGTNNNTTETGTVQPAPSPSPTMPSNPVPEQPSAVNVTSPPVIDNNIFNNKSQAPTPVPIPPTASSNGTTTPAPVQPMASSNGTDPPANATLAPSNAPSLRSLAQRGSSKQTLCVTALVLLFSLIVNSL